MANSMVLRRDGVLVNLNEVTNIEKSAGSPMIRFWTGVNQSANWRFDTPEVRDKYFMKVAQMIGAKNLEPYTSLCEDERFDLTGPVDFVICQSGAKIVNLNKVCNVDVLANTGIRLWFSNNQNILLRCDKNKYDIIFENLMKAFVSSTDVK